MKNCSLKNWVGLALSSFILLTACQSSKSSLHAIDQPIDQPIDQQIPQSTAKTTDSKQPTKIIWNSNFNTPDWQQDWQIRSQGQWGMENTAVIPDETGQFGQVLRVLYPAGSASPTVTRKGSPSGGAQFYSTLNQSPRDRVKLSYSLRFSRNFDFVKGGKLPGLYGGKGNSGGNIPNGKDGFSSRLMWRKNGAGEVYAYLPKSKTNGTSLGRGQWTFRPNTWHQIQQELQLNTPDRSDGWIRVWFDQKLVLEESNLRFRNTSTLNIDGIFFSTFFGGDDRSWSTPKDVSIDFASFSVEVPSS